MQIKAPDWLATAGYLAAASFVAHALAYTQTPQHNVTWRWFVTSVPTAITLGLVAGFLGDVLKIGQLGTVGLASLLGWLGTPILTALASAVIDRIKSAASLGDKKDV